MYLLEFDVQWSRFIYFLGIHQFDLDSSSTIIKYLKISNINFWQMNFSIIIFFPAPNFFINEWKDYWFIQLS